MSSPIDHKPAPRIGLALGGGGPLGGIYEIGALRALDEALDGLDFNNIDVYVGVNGGSFVAANLANQMTTAQLCRIFVRNEAEVHPFHPEVFYRPAFREIGSRLLAIPGLVSTAVSRFVNNPYDQSLLEAMTILAQAAPAGLFDNEGLHEYLKRAFTMLGRTNDFRQLKRSLYIVAADVESTEAVCFGAPGFDHVPISKAIQASTASPGLYVPVEIDGRYYVDGTLRKGLHASVAFEDGADLVFAVNPQVPIDASAAVRAGSMKPGELTRSGMPNVLSQTFRTMVYSRMQSGIAQYARDYPDKDILLFEPTRDDAKLFFSNVFSFQSRRMVCEHAYQMTRRDLLSRADQLEPKLAKYGIKLRRDRLEDEQRTISTSLYGEMLPLYVAKGRKKKAEKGRLAGGLTNVSHLFSKAQ
ncbi:Predicted acylesterase/phospholipase RssA, contains patatin domain [Marinobacter sp. DSM 26671]|jgi:predicted acylesterase/phospholipase RssA|uniref:Patatin family protein n=6 Tax=Marinobacter TaxID=2742 RepID=A0A3D8GZW4_9GAMM|nr:MULTISPECIES: patatin-like phospholipase family protein [Marinobacter]MCR9190371.1 patatin-like phospholipase family protein [Alteromonadaceae bacterium]ADP96228.1 protein containing Patatin domain [Marinobacter adhaerens HP15]AKV97079.1 patatin [Marinobacter sp. CP1]EHJ05764.1 patatin [Marinobacter manganoxydans MnI7-9]MAK48825.1 patatin [Marinobacter sp.]|tara:strand:+ start:103 stop:1344 length:1242 start_codon:yes stop_codon:yes gene_type:complete